jgi:benzoyl-CoA reductase/2-hydroxyglutaryl-CoA dehydratase subunit BcrC/BadD/HgdB
MDTVGSFEGSNASKATRRLADAFRESPRPHKKSPALALFDEILEKTLHAFAAESRAPFSAAEEQSRVIGGVVGWAPLMRALDVRPGRGLLGMSRNSHVSVGVAEDYFQIPPEACTAMKVKLGAHHVEDLRRGGKKTGKVVHFGGDCEPDVMATELLRGDGYDTFIVEPVTAFKMPPSRRDAYVKFYANEAQRLAIWLTGKPVDDDKLAEEIRNRNTILAKFQEMMRLRLHNPFYVPLARVTQINHLSNIPKHREAWLAAMNLLLEELRGLANEPSPFHIPLILVGVMHCEDLYHAIDETIGAVVAGFISELYREDLPPLESLGDYLLQMQLRGELHDKCGSVVSLRRDRIERELKEFGARGVIVGGTTNCPYLAIAREMEYEYFTQKGIPVLVLDGTAHNDPATEEQKMRLRAFIEMML